MTQPPTRSSVVIIGLGNSMRGDDGVGPAAIELLVADELDDIETVTLDGESTRLIDAWRDRRRAVVVDAICLGDAAGTLHEVEVGRDRLPSWSADTSSHQTGLAEAVALGRALDRLPAQMTVLGLEPGDISPGHGLSPEVQAGLAGLVERVRVVAAR